MPHSPPQVHLPFMEPVEESVETVIDLQVIQDNLLQEIKAELDEIRSDIRRNMIIAVSVLLSISLMGFGVLLTLHYP